MAGDRERRGRVPRSGRRIAEPLSYKLQFCVWLRVDNEPRWREIAKALEYWALSALVVGSLLYGIFIAIRNMIAGAN